MIIILWFNPHIIIILDEEQNQSGVSGMKASFSYWSSGAQCRTCKHKEYGNGIAFFSHLFSTFHVSPSYAQQMRSLP